MLDVARKAVDKTIPLTRETYDADENLRLALTHLVQVIAEAARHVSHDFTITPAKMILIPVLGTARRVSEVLAAKRHRSMTMIRRLRDRFHIPADLLIPPSARKRTAA